MSFDLFRDACPKAGLDPSKVELAVIDGEEVRGPEAALTGGEWIDLLLPAQEVSLHLAPQPDGSHKLETYHW